MKAKSEVSVDRLEFRKAVSWTGRGRAADRERTYLYMDKHDFVVETARAQTRVKSVGEWSKPVAVNSGMLKRLASKLPHSKETTLLYFDGQLMVGPVRIGATEVEG